MAYSSPWDLLILDLLLAHLTKIVDAYHTELVTSIRHPVFVNKPSTGNLHPVDLSIHPVDLTRVP